MVTHSHEPARLVGLPAAERPQALGQFFVSLVGLPTQERRDNLHAYVRAQLGLSPEQMDPLITDQLRSWGRLDPEIASLVAAEYVTVAQEFPEPFAERITSALVEDLERLDDEDQRAAATVLADVLVVPDAEASRASGHSEDTDRRWWQVWKPRR